MRFPRVLMTAAIGLASSTAAFGQQPEPKPIGPVALDIRVVFPRFESLPGVAEPLDVNETDLPGHGMGLVFGAHWYAARLKVITLGLGGELLVSRGSSNVSPEQEGGPDGPAIKTRFSSLSPQISLNFGKREGWSYLTAGLGSGVFETEREDRPLPAGTTRAKVLNYGGGARWFPKKHMALSLDLRFYAVSPQEATTTRVEVPRTKILVMSGGIAFQ
jgi:hypothetical protein